MTKKTMSAATMAEEGLSATCGGIVRDYLAHRGYEARAADGWSCDCGDAPIVAMDADEAVLVAVISAYEEGSATMPELSVGAAESAMMRRVCLLCLANHGDVDAQRQEHGAKPCRPRQRQLRQPDPQGHVGDGGYRRRQLGARLDGPHPATRPASVCDGRSDGLSRQASGLRMAVARPASRS